MATKISSQEELDALYDEYHRAFGEALREWAQFEILFGWLLCSLLQIDSFKTRVVWSSLPNFTARKRLLVRLGETFLDESCLPEFRRLMKRAGRLSSSRNMMAHAHGGVENDDKYVFLWDDDDRDGGGFDFSKSQSLQLQNIKDWARAINQLGSDCVDYRKRMRLHSLSKMHREQRSDPNQRSDPRPPESTPAKRQRPPQSWRLSHQSLEPWPQIREHLSPASDPLALAVAQRWRTKVRFVGEWTEPLHWPATWSQNRS